MRIMTELESEEETEEMTVETPPEQADTFATTLVMPDQSVEELQQDHYVITADELAEFSVLCLYAREKNRSLVLTSLVKFNLWLKENRLSFDSFLKGWRFCAALMESEDFERDMIDPFFAKFHTYGEFLVELEFKRKLLANMDKMFEEHQQMYVKWKQKAGNEMFVLIQKKKEIEAYLKKITSQS